MQTVDIDRQMLRGYIVSLFTSAKEVAVLPLSVCYDNSRKLSMNSDGFFWRSGMYEWQQLQGRIYGGGNGGMPPRCQILCNMTLKQHNPGTAIKNTTNGIKLRLSFSPGLKFQAVYFKKYSSFWGTPSTNPLLGLRP